MLATLILTCLWTSANDTDFNMFVDEWTSANDTHFNMFVDEWTSANESPET